MSGAIEINADTSGISAFAGGMSGMLTAVTTTAFKSNFLGNAMNQVRKEFMISAEANRDHLKHVFEWGDEQGQVGTRPLFAVTKNGSGSRRYMSFRFLDSTKQVPFPDEGRYGFTLNGNMKPHVFRKKALVMETQSEVVISPRPDNKKGLFIPWEQADKGYIMIKGSTVINPGGTSTGKFSEFWEEWFRTEAPRIMAAKAKAAEEVLAATGQKVIRYAAGTVRGGVKVGGRFAKGESASFAYVNAERLAEGLVEAEMKSAFRDNEPAFADDLYLYDDGDDY